MTTDNSTGAPARLLSVNVGAVRAIEWRGETLTTAIWKAPVAGAVAVRGVNLDGDDQADRSVHGGLDKAVYAYAIEDYGWWESSSAIDAAPGLFGENLTTEGVDLRAALVGERWRVGTTVLEVAQPRLPCFKLGIRMGDQRFVRRFLAAGRLGAYFRIVEEGVVRAGDAIAVVHRPAHAVTLGLMAEALHDRAKGRELLAAGPLPGFWRRVAAGEVD